MKRSHEPVRRRFYNTVARKSAPTTFSQPEPPQPKPAKRPRTMYDLGDTFEVIVGRSPSPSQTFTLHTHVFTDRSKFLTATRKSESITVKELKPVRLDDEDPDLFQIYINCVYFGLDVEEQWADAFDSSETSDEAEASGQKQKAVDALFEKQIRLYLLAKRLDDYKTANAVIDEIIRFSNVIRMIPMQASICQAYTGTQKDEPLRELLCDFFIHDAAATCSDILRTNEYPHDFLHELAVGLFEVVRLDSGERDYSRSVADISSEDVCHYHLHNEQYPRCNLEESDEDEGK